jgi:TRAP-type C4-dicarboxylate transport system permease large subunit
VILSGLRGGLSVATILASACFGAVCGSSIATAATMTRIALREMRQAGSADSLATGSIAAGGSLGILFPPSIILVLFSYFMVQTQLPDLLANGARALALPGFAVMILVIVAYLVMGCFLEGIGMILIARRTLGNARARRDICRWAAGPSALRR